MTAAPVRGVRERILASVRRSGSLPRARSREAILRLETVAKQLRDEGLIACTNGRWWLRGEPPQWGQAISGASPRFEKPDARQTGMFEGAY